LKTNDIYKILLEEIFDWTDIRFNIFPLNVSDVSIIPRAMAYWDFTENSVVSSDNMDHIPMFDFGTIVTVPEMLEDKYEDSFLRISLRSNLYASTILPPVNTLKSLYYPDTKGFISAKIEQTEIMDKFETEIKIRGKLAVYGE
jgi:hypothetical protein